MRPSILDIIYKLDPTTSDPSAVQSVLDEQKIQQLLVWTSGGQPSGDGTPTGGGLPSSDRDYTKGRGLWGATPPSYSPPDYSPLGVSGLPDFSKLLGASALASVLNKLSAEPPSIQPPSPQLPPSGGGSPGYTAPISPDYLLDQRNPENIVNRLSAAYGDLKNRLDQTVSSYSDVLTYSDSGITMSPQLQGLVNLYEQALNELKSSLPDVEKTLKDKFGDYVNVSNGRVDLAPEVKALVDMVNEFSLLYNNIQQNYNSALFDLVKRYNLKIENNTLVFDFDRVKPELDEVKREYGRRVEELVKKYNLQRDENGRLVADPSVLDKARAELEEINQWYGSALDAVLNKYNLKATDDGYIVFDYDKVKAELDAINKKHNDALDKLYSQYGAVVNRRVVDGKVVYELKPEAQAALVLQGQVAETVKDLAAAQQQALQNVVNKYSGVLSYDKTTGKVALSKELEEMVKRYQQATQEVNKLTGALSTVAGMIPAFAQQLPVFKVKFQTFDKSQNKFVETGGETPIYIKDENLWKEVADWMSQNKDQVEVVALHDPNSRGRPYVVYVFNKDTKEGYVIDPVEGMGFRVKGTEEGRVFDPATGKWEQLRGIELYMREKSLDIWSKSLTDEEKKKLEKWLEVRQKAAEIEQMPPVARELYAAMLGAGRFAVITPAIDVVSRWLRGENPTKGIEKFEIEAAAAAEASPLAHTVGQAVGLAGVAGLAAESLIAKGASLGASGVGRQFLTGLRSTLKPAVASTVAGATFGAVEGALTGRDPLAEASKFGTIGLMTGLGGVAREQLITAGLLSGVVGATTAKKYGVEKGLEAGSAVFPLAFVAPDVLSRGLGGVAMETASARRPRPAVGLKSEPVPAAEAGYAQIVRNVASRIRSRMEVKPEPGLTPDDVASIAAQLRFNPAEQRALFQSLMEDALVKIRGGGDADVVLTQLRLIRQKLDSVSRMRFDEVLRQYGLTEVKTAAPEYSLREEEAQKLARLFRRAPEYQLTDESAKVLNWFLRQTPEYKLDDAVAQQLNLFLKMPRREYGLTDEAAAWLDQFLKMEPPLTGRASAELAEAAVRPKLRQVLTGKTAVELAGRPRLEPPLTGRVSAELAGQRTVPRLEPMLTSRAELEASARSQPELRPALTAKTEIQLQEVQRQEPRVEAGSQLRLPEVQKSALVYALKTRAELIPEVAMTPEIKQAVEWAREFGRKLWELGTELRPVIRPPPADKEPPDKERKIIPTLPTLQVEPPSTVKPPYEIPKSPEDEPKYNPPPLTTTTAPPTVDVPPPPTYTPVPTYEMPPVYTSDVPPPPTYTPVPTYEMPPVYTSRVDVPPTDVPKVPLLEGPPPTPLPHGWWRLLPPGMFAEDNKEGAYRAQEGKRQILALA